MTPERLDKIESILLRAACCEALDSRQRYIKLGLELVEGLRRSKDLESGAAAKIAEVRRWYSAAKELLRDAVTILKMVPDYAATDAWHNLKNRFVDKVLDNG